MRAAAGLMLVMSLGIFWAVTQMTQAMFASLGSRLVAPILVECLAIGVIVMASIQTVRGVFPVRGAFHRQRMVLWLSRLEDVHKALDKRVGVEVLQSYLPLITDTPKNESRRLPEPEAALDALLGLTTTQALEKTDRPHLAFFDLPLEQLCGQISVGAERAIIDPKKHAPLLVLLAGSGGLDDAIEFLKQDAAQSEVVTVNGAKQSKETDGADMKSARQDAFMQARSKVEERIRRNIDWLQIDTAYRWKLGVRCLAIALAAALGLLSALASGQYTAIPASMAVAGIAGGFFATVTRDLVAVVERLRR